MKTAILFILLILVSCTKQDTTPEASLKNFVESSIGTVLTKETVLGFVTGKLKENFENMPQAEFDQFADMRNVKRDSFKILSKSCEGNKCFLTYSLSFKTTADKANYSSEVKKIAEIELVGEKWLISDVSNIKTYHESSDPINPLE